MNYPTPESRGDLGQVLQNSEPEQNGSGRRVGILARVSISPDALRVLPSAFVKRHRILPLEISNGTIHIATADPGNLRVIDDIRLLSGLEVKETESPGSEILEKIAECYQLTVEQMVENLHPDQGATI